MYIFLLCLFSLHARAQNLVNNPSFEQIITCPYSFGYLTNGCAGWKNFGSIIPNYYNRCNISPNYSVPTNTFGYQDAANGNAYAGVYTYTSSINNAKEYITNTMAPMVVGTHYEVSMSVSLSDNSGFGGDDLGVYFYDKAPSYYADYDTLPVQPQVTYSSYGPISNKLTWKRLTKIYVADSAYDNIAIGGFLPYANMVLDTVPPGNFAYYYIDSVVVRKVRTSLIFTDSVLCHGEQISVPFSFYAGSYFNPGNVFSLELSDANGNFYNPTILNTLASTSSGTITASIPSTLPAGSKYRLKILSSDPVDSSTDNGIDINIYPTPVPLAKANTPICEGDTLKLEASCTTPVSSYRWYGPNFIPTGVVGNPYQVLGVTLPFSGDYQLKAQYYDCIGWDTISVLVKPRPVNVTSTNNSPLCEDATLVLNGNTGTSGVNFSWQGPGLFNSSSKDTSRAVVTMNDSGYYKFKVIYNGCATTDSTHVIIKPTPRPVAFASNNLCEGDSLLLFVPKVINGETYTWNGVNNFYSTSDINVIHNLTAAAAGDYIVTVNADGCIGKDTVTVSVKPNPPVPVAIVNTPVCEGETLYFDASNTDNIVTYKWKGPGGYNMNGAGNSIHNAVPANSGLYIITANRNGCELYDTISVRVKPLPDTPNIVSNSPLQTGQNLYLDLKNPQTGAQYQWTGPNGFQSQSTNPVINKPGISYSGSYFLLATLEGCQRSNVVYVQIDEQLDTGFIQLYPTVNEGNFSIKALLKSDQQIPMHILDAEGREVFNTLLKTDRKRLKAEVELQGYLASGVYTAHIIADGKKQSLRFIVRRQ